MILSLLTSATSRVGGNPTKNAFSSRVATRFRRSLVVVIIHIVTTMLVLSRSLTMIDGFVIRGYHPSIRLPQQVLSRTRVRDWSSWSQWTFDKDRGNSRKEPMFRYYSSGMSPASSLTSSRFRLQSSSTDTTSTEEASKLITLSTVSDEELTTLIVDAWKYPKFRAKQVLQWIHDKGITDLSKMHNIPKQLRKQLEQVTKEHALEMVSEQVSKDGTIKRAYRLMATGELIESVLMPYQDGRYTACISSQAGCAQGCVFCATGQMGFQRQLTDSEIYEQVYRFASMLQQQDKRLSNIVFMGMGEPLANYRNVKRAINRIVNDIGIGARKITVSTVGIVPNIRKLLYDKEVPQVRLAVSLHCANDEERSALLPANARYGGLDELMTVLKEYIDVTKRRITLEWALIHGENDSVDTARQLGQLLRKYNLRRDMLHVNVIPLNPTKGYAEGSPSQQNRVNAFCQTLEKEYGVACTPRVRRGIDIDAGCGQLKSQVLEQEERERKTEEIAVEAEGDKITGSLSFEIVEDAVDFESDDYEDPEYLDQEDRDEAARLIALVKGSTIPSSILSEPSNPASVSGQEKTLRVSKKQQQKRKKRESTGMITR